MNVKRIFLFVVGAGMFFVIMPLLSVTYAATLSFNPSSVDVNTGETFEMEVFASIDDKEVLGIDTLIEYDSNILSVESIADGTYLEIAQKEFGEAGKIYIAGVIDSPGTSVTGEGVLATITFKAKGAGTTKITFVCELGETTESNILENSTDAPDLIECSSNGEAEVNVDGGSRSGGTNPQSTPSALPKSGVYDSFASFALIGGILFIVGVGVKLLL